VEGGMIRKRGYRFSEEIMLRQKSVVAETDVFRSDSCMVAVIQARRDQ
jgi:hypothetical protein